MLKVALTGGIGSGKTAASKRFQTLGVPVIDADIISRQLVEPGSEALTEISRVFSTDILQQDGSLDRKKLRELIFSSPAKKHQLENILHPRIRTAMQKALDQLDAVYAIQVIPLLVENGLQSTADRILVVDVPETLQIERVAKRDAINPEQVALIMESQANRQQRLAIADDILENTGSLDDLLQKVDQLHNKYLNLAKRP